MKNQLAILFLCFFSIASYGQERMLQGILEDKGEPILFGTVAVFRNDVLVRGTETDLDGKYAILCQVGDEIEASYIGYTPSRFTVTGSMLNNSENMLTIKVEPVKSNAYKEAMTARRSAWDKKMLAPSTNIQKTIKVEYPNNYHGATGLEIKDDNLIFIKQKGKYNYNIDVRHTSGVSFVQNRNLPQLQSVYAQGRPVDGELIHQDFTSGEQFSWGPKVVDEKPDNNLITSSTFHNTSLSLDYMRNDWRKYMTLSHQRQSDIFDVEDQRSVGAKVGVARYYEMKQYVAVELSVSAEKIGNHNATGYYQNVLKSMMVQSPTFDSATKIDGEYVSFSSAYNNPRWILENNHNSVSRKGIGLFLQHKSHNYRELNYSNSLKLELNFIDVDENFAPQTVGQEQGLIRNLDYLNPKALLVSSFEKPIDDNENMCFYFSNFLEGEHLRFRTAGNGSSEFSSSLVRTSPRVGIKNKHGKLNYNIGYIPIISTIQNTEWVSTDIDISYNFEMDKKFLDELIIKTRYDRRAKNQELYLSRNNYSAQTNNSYEALGSTFDLPLFLPDDLENEVSETKMLGVSFVNNYKSNKIGTGLVYRNLRQTDVIFPMEEVGVFVLRNAGDFNTKTIEWRSYVSWKDYRKKLHYHGMLNVIRYTTNVTDVNHDKTVVSGFGDVSKQLIVGQSVGVIVGSDYKRNEDGLMIIGEDGFPILDEESTIIGDPTPWFIFEGSSKLQKGKYQFLINIDGQVGGQVWNGTQQALDYHVVSQSTAELREEEDYIFEGVVESGQINTLPVSLADPSLGLEGNRWTRYGREGVASDYITDASFLRIKRVSIGYTTSWTRGKEVQVNLFATNLFTFAPFRGFSTNFLFEDDLSGGLQYFNQPISSQVGISAHFKL